MADKYRIPEKKGLKANFKLMQRLLPTQFSFDKSTGDENDEDLPRVFPGMFFKDFIFVFGDPVIPIYFKTFLCNDLKQSVLLP